MLLPQQHYLKDVQLQIIETDVRSRAGCMERWKNCEESVEGSENYAAETNILYRGAYKSAKWGFDIEINLLVACYIPTTSNSPKKSEVKPVSTGP